MPLVEARRSRGEAQQPVDPDHSDPASGKHRDRLAFQAARVRLSQLHGQAYAQPAVNKVVTTDIVVTFNNAVTINKVVTIYNVVTINKAFCLNKPMKICVFFLLIILQFLKIFC